MAKVIEMKNVTFSYNGKNIILEDISLSIKKGEIFGLIGPSGAGKTTIVKLLTGQLEGKHQCINVFGEKPYSTGFYNRIGMVIETIGLYDRLSCYENLRVISKIHGITHERIINVLEQVGLKDSMNKEVYKLSTGMKQRVMIARAILHSPEILFLDEPTRALDPVTANDVQEMLLDLKNQGTTIFLTTHNMPEAERLCDNVGLLFDGKIVEFGKIEKIKRKYTYEKKIKFIDDKGKEHIYLQRDFKDKLINDIRENNNFSIHTLEPTLEEIFINIKEGV